MIIIGIAIAAGLLMAVLIIVRRTSSVSVQESHDSSFEIARSQEDSTIGRLFLAAGRNLAGLPYTNVPEESPAYRSLRTKLAASGGLYAGSVAVFLSVQVAAGILSAMLLAVLLFVQGGWMVMVVGALLAVGIGAYPYQRLVAAAKKRAEKVDQCLPEFAELLIMPLSSGYGILPGLGFTAERTAGPVADEVKLMLSAISSRAANEKEAFEAAGDRLGTPAAKSFFNALSQAYLEGVSAVTTISGQAEQLRKLSYQRLREKLKILPNKLVFIIALHLMPTLFIVILTPLLYGLTHNTLTSG